MGLTPTAGGVLIRKTHNLYNKKPELPKIRRRVGYNLIIMNTAKNPSNVLNNFSQHLQEFIRSKQVQIKKIITLLFALLLFQNIPARSQDMDTYHNCPLVGKVSSGNSPQRKKELEDLNKLKNRYSFPKAEDFDNSVTLEKMLGVDQEHDRNKFDITKAVTIEGYIVYAATTGSKESCNCQTTSANYTDQHFELALTPEEPKDGRTVIVEITPRIRQIMHQGGEDWTHAEMKKYVGHKVRVSGWLFYDAEHEKDACSYHPEKCGDVPGFNRHTCWEVHPITSFEDITDDNIIASVSTGESEAETDDNVKPSANPSAPISPVGMLVTSNNKPQYMEPLQYLILILLGGILGTVGQLLRVIIGLKKAADAGKETDYKRASFSLLLSFAVGSVAGVLAAIGSTDVAFDKSTITAFLTAGYAGTDFIEGFMQKNRV